MWFIGVEVEQETSAPPPKKNPGSAPAPDFKSAEVGISVYWIPVFKLQYTVYPIYTVYPKTLADPAGWMLQLIYVLKLILFGEI